MKVRSIPGVFTGSPASVVAALGPLAGPVPPRTTARVSGRDPLGARSRHRMQYRIGPGANGRATPMRGGRMQWAKIRAPA